MIMRCPLGWDKYVLLRIADARCEDHKRLCRVVLLHSLDA